eukprot:gene7193-302_t
MTNAGGRASLTDLPRPPRASAEASVLQAAQGLQGGSARWEDVFIDPKTLPEGAGGMCQLTFLLAAYGYILFSASNMISNGSELLLLTPLAGLVGSVVLPVLGAVPDGAIVLFSGNS